VLPLRVTVATSVYAIPSHWGTSKINSYKIVEGSSAGELEYQKSINLAFSGTVDVDIDTKSEILCANCTRGVRA